MKKVTVMVLAVLAAAGVQAVSVNWGGNSGTARVYGLTSGTQLSFGVGSETAMMSMLYIFASDYAALSGVSDYATSLTYAKATASGSTGTTATWSGRVVSSSVYQGQTASGIQYFARAFTTIGGQEYYMDLQNGNSAYWTTALAGDQSITETLAWSAATYGGATGVQGEWGKWVAVPEPTSFALLALGAAALGLRRRIRKA